MKKKKMVVMQAIAEEERSRLMTVEERAEIARLIVEPDEWRVICDLTPTHELLDEVGIPRDEKDMHIFLSVYKINPQLNF